jgi:hypothetical protein
MTSSILYLKIDLGAPDAFGQARWAESKQGATAFRSEVAAKGVKSMMPGATGLMEHVGEFYVVKASDGSVSKKEK